MNEERGSWYLLTGLLIGLALGLVYAWFIDPLLVSDTFPPALRADHKDFYRVLVSRAYQANQDLVRAKARLAQLQDPDPYQTLAAQVQRNQGESGSPDDAAVLGTLASAIAQGSYTIVESPDQPVQGGIAPAPTPFATYIYTPTIQITSAP